jgi:phosphohistidine phosphatase SixA
MRRRKPATFHLLLALAIFSAAPAARASGQEAPEPTVVFLVRHAERADDGTGDPPISAEGEARAELLASMLRDAGVTAVHTTPYRRTRATGEPAASEAGVEMSEYRPDASGLLVDRIRAAGGRHLVIGHSNTVPELVAAMGGAPGDPIEESEYDRLYIVTLTADGASSVLLRFGALTGP